MTEKKKDRKIALHFEPNDAETARYFTERPDFDPRARHIYIAAEDGEYYELTEKELKQARRVTKEDPNRGVLDFLTGHGVSHAGLDKHEVARLRRHRRFSQTGMWVTCFFAVHFLNLGTVSRTLDATELEEAEEAPPNLPKRERPK